MSVAIVTVATGGVYRSFLTEWSRAVRALERKPDEVVIVTDYMTLDVLEAMDRTGARVLQASQEVQHHPQVLINQAIAATSSDWVCKMDVDDIIYPHALNTLHTTDADVHMFGIRVTEPGKEDRVLPAFPIHTADILSTFDNLVFSGSPFRRWVWEHNPFRDMVYEDWAFWIEAAKAGARFHQSTSIDYEYRQHGMNISGRSDDHFWREAVRNIWASAS